MDRSNQWFSLSPNILCLNCIPVRSIISHQWSPVNCVVSLIANDQISDLAFKRSGNISKSISATGNTDQETKTIYMTVTDHLFITMTTEGCYPTVKKTSDVLNTNKKSKLKKWFILNMRCTLKTVETIEAESVRLLFSLSFLLPGVLLQVVICV